MVRNFLDALRLPATYRRTPTQPEWNGDEANGRSIPVYRDNIAVSGSRERPCSSPGRARWQRSLARHRGGLAREAGCQASPQQKCASGRHQERPQGFCLSDRADADRRYGNGCRQGAGKHQRGRRRADRAHRLAEHRGRPAATRAGHHHQRHYRQSISCRTYNFEVSLRLRSPVRRRDWRFTRTGAHQRSVRRHRQLGPDPDRCDQVGHRRDQQSRIRPQRAGRSRQRADEGWLQLSRAPKSTRWAARSAASRVRRSGASRSTIFPSMARWKDCATTDSAIFRNRPSAASTAMSATGPTAANFTSTWASPTTISARPRRCRSNCCRIIGARPTPRRRPQPTRSPMSI